MVVDEKGSTERAYLWVSEIDAIVGANDSCMSIEDVLTTKKCFACDPENGGDVDVFLKKKIGRKVLQEKCRRRRRWRYL